MKTERSLWQRHLEWYDRGPFAGPSFPEEEGARHAALFAHFVVEVFAPRRPDGPKANAVVATTRDGSEIALYWSSRRGADDGTAGVEEAARRLEALGVPRLPDRVCRGGGPADA